MMRIAAAVTVASLGLLVAASSGRADEEKVALKDVPKAVLDAIKAKFPGAELTEAAKETEDGKTTYEVALKDKAGKAVDVAATAEGKITEIETTIAAKDLPKAVVSAIDAKYPKATVKKAEEIVAIDGDKETKSFEVVLTTADKKTLEVKLSPEGKALEEEDDDEDK
jgi:hypothetical protein